MNDDTPPPVESVGRNQEAPARTEALIVMPEVPMQSLAVADRLQGLAMSYRRAFGGEVAAQLLAVSIQQLSGDLTETKDSLRLIQERLSSKTEEAAKLTVENAVLKVKLVNISRVAKFGNVGIALGVGAIGFGIDGVRGAYFEVGIGLLILGISICLFSWFSSPKEASK